MVTKWSPHLEPNARKNRAELVNAVLGIKDFQSVFGCDIHTYYITSECFVYSNFTKGCEYL